MGAQPLAQRMPRDERLEVSEGVVVTAEQDLRLGAELDALQSRLVEPRRLVARERCAREVGQRVAPPQLEGAVAERGARAGRHRRRARPPRFEQQLLEAAGVELARLDDEQIARGCG